LNLDIRYLLLLVMMVMTKRGCKKREAGGEPGARGEKIVTIVTRASFASAFKGLGGDDRRDVLAE
jgi:hypothetical protein